MSVDFNPNFGFDPELPRHSMTYARSFEERDSWSVGSIPQPSLVRFETKVETFGRLGDGSYGGKSPLTLTFTLWASVRMNLQRFIYLKIKQSLIADENGFLTTNEPVVEGGTYTSRSESLLTMDDDLLANRNPLGSYVDEPWRLSSSPKHFVIASGRRFRFYGSAGTTHWGTLVKVSGP